MVARPTSQRSCTNTPQVLRRWSELIGVLESCAWNGRPSCSSRRMSPLRMRSYSTRSHDSCRPAFRSCVPAPRRVEEVAAGEVALVAAVGVERLRLRRVDPREAHHVADGDVGRLHLRLIADREDAPHAAEARVEHHPPADHVVVLGHVVLRRLVLQHGRLVLDEQVRRVAAVEAIVDVLVEQERRADGRRGLPGALADEVADAVVVDGLRAVGVERADLELIEPPPADRAEEPRLVARDRAAERRAPVVADVDRVAGRAALLSRLQAEARPQVVVDVVALQGVVHEVEVVVRREAVAARLRDHVHVDAGDVALRGARGRLHVVFLVHLEAVVHHRGAAVAAGPVHLEAVDAERLLAVGRAEGLDVVLLRALGAADVEAAGDHAGHEAGHGPRVAARGDGLVEVLVDVGLRHRRRDVDDRRRAAHGDRLLQVADAELDVDARGARDLDDDAFALERREAGEFERHHVGAGRQGELVAAGLAADLARLPPIRLSPVDRDGDAGEHAALRVAHRAGERAGLLRHRRRGHERAAASAPATWTERETTFRSHGEEPIAPSCDRRARDRTGRLCLAAMMSEGDE